MEEVELKIGIRVRTNVDFAGIPKGTEGEIIKYPRSWPENSSVAVQWNRHKDDRLVDWFNTRNELQFLEVCNGNN